MPLSTAFHDVCPDASLTSYTEFNTPEGDFQTDHPSPIPGSSQSWPPKHIDGTNARLLRSLDWHPLFAADSPLARTTLHFSLPQISAPERPKPAKSSTLMSGQRSNRQQAFPTNQRCCYFLRRQYLKQLFSVGSLVGRLGLVDGGVAALSRLEKKGRARLPPRRALPPSEIEWDGY